MSREKVEIVRAVFERRREGDFKSHFDLFDPHVVLVLRPEFPDAGAHFGIGGDAPHDGGGGDSRRAGDTVIVGLRQRAAGEASGAATEFRYFQLWTFRGGKVIRLPRATTDPSAAGFRTLERYYNTGPSRSAR